MGANKNSSRMMNSAYAPNSQPRIPTRVCHGHVVTMNLPTLGINPNSKQHGSTTQEARELNQICRVQTNSLQGNGGQSARLWRTVCRLQADQPQPSDRLSQKPIESPVPHSGNTNGPSLDSELSAVIPHADGPSHTRQHRPNTDHRHGKN
jgi:hypothetical protein